MERASDDLKHEHDAILFSLNILEEICRRIESGRDVPAGDLSGITGFLKLFADKCHHGKEEGFLFPALEEAGIPRQNGPIGVMLSEHDKGRNFIKGMEGAIKENGVDKTGFTEAARGYISLLRDHIEKENKVLFPMGDSKLTAAKQEELIHSFGEFEEKVIGAGKHEELHAMLNDYKKRYMK